MVLWSIGFITNQHRIPPPNQPVSATALVVNLVRTFPSAKFICFDAILGVIITSHAPKYDEPAKIQAKLLNVALQYWLSLFSLCRRTYELQHSLDLALLTRGGSRRSCWGDRAPPLKPKKLTFFTMIFYNSENSIRDITLFDRPLFCDSSVVKYSLLHLFYSSEPVMRLDCQILLKSPPLNLLDPPLLLSNQPVFLQNASGNPSRRFPDRGGKNRSK